MRRLFVLVLAGHWLLATGHCTAADKPVPTKDAAAKMTVPEGFRVSLFAGEPDIVQPIAFTFDHRGRMWVVECLSYPKWRTDGKGNDRVTILEDTDGDGTFDKKTVFLDNGVNLSGIELGFSGVWLCATPNLIFVPDKDGDDKPDGPPEVLLDGWNIKDTKHNVFNGLIWGPDGWLYGCNGIQTKSRVGKPGTPDTDRVYLDCGVWRYHPTRRAFEVVAHGTTNPWGLDFDELGEMFITNCVIDHLWHVVPGGHYQRMYGQDANPYSFGLMSPASDHKHWAGGHWTDSRADKATGAVQKGHDDAGGGHAHSGCAIYLGDNFPAEYRNNVFTCNIHGSRLNRDTLHRTKTGYVGKHAKDFLFANDPWFRGICVKCGPDGGMYVSDWTDTGECHNYDVADTTNGRIYRVVYGQPKAKARDLSKLPDAALVEMQTDRNEWTVRMARRLLQDRAAAGKLEETTTVTLRKQLTAADAAHRLRAMWALHCVGALTAKDHVGLLKDEHEAVRGWGLSLAFENGKPTDDAVVGAAFSIPKAEESSHVRTRLASVLQRVDPTLQRELAGELLSRPETDPNLALMLWYAVQPAVLDDPGAMLAVVRGTSVPIVRELIVRCYAGLSHADRDTAAWRLQMLLDECRDGSRRAILLDILRGLRDANAGRKDPLVPPKWSEFGNFHIGHTPDVHVLAEELSVIFNDKPSIDQIRERITQKGHTDETRRRAITVLAGRKVPDLGPTLRTALADLALRGAAVRALAAYPDAETPAALLKVYPVLSADEKTDAVLTLASRPTFATKLLDAIEAGTVPKADVSAFAARQIQALNNKAVSERLAKVWGTVRPASATFKSQAEKFKKLLTAETLAKADVANGRAVFVKHCASCHKLFGEGGDVGPELTGSQRANLDYVLENVLDPSAAVPGEYRMTTFNLVDGRTVTGVIRKETPQAVIIRTVNEEIIVATADIDSRKGTALSIMPDGLFDAMKETEIRDLVAYLASPKQVALPK